jgi:hypothetical protein
VKRGGKKDGEYAFIRSMQDRFKCDVKIDGKKEKKGRKKGRRKGREGGKVAERKMPNMHLLESRKLRFNVA